MTRSRLCFASALAWDAWQFFCVNINEHNTFTEMVNLRRVQYNSKSQQLRVQAHLESLYFTAFMLRRNLSDAAIGLSSLVEHINTQTFRLDVKLGDQEHKSRYLRHAEVSDWEKIPLRWLVKSSLEVMELFLDSPQNVKPIPEVLYVVNVDVPELLVLY